MAALGPTVLYGEFIRLEPLREVHRDALLRVAEDDRIWSWLPRKLQTVDEMNAFLASSRDEEAKGQAYAFAVVLRGSGRLVGSTRYLDITPADRGVEIGSTWYAPDVWGTRVNPEAKYLLMRHAFEDWQAIRVCFKTDERNERSRRAIAKLGASFEGILRNHRIRRDGSFRGSAYFSVIESEWPQVKSGLMARLSQG
jgi:N-acetyltransferase